MTRALPDHDPTIDALDPARRALLAEIWAGRAASELAAGAAFAVVERELNELGADPAVLELARRAVADEPRHSELCRRLAEAYGGHVVARPEPPEVEVPRHDGIEPALRGLLHVVAMCCINETIACAFVEACLAEAEGPLVAAIHREHLGDEIHHARIGWAHLASSRVDGALRTQLAAWLPRLLDANLRHWESRLVRLPAAGVPGHALPPVPSLIAAARAAVADLILPGFDHVGIDTAAARAWFEAYAPAPAAWLATFERWLAAVHAPADRDALAAAVTDDVVLERHAPGTRDQPGAVVQTLRGTGELAHWFEHTPPGVAFSLVGEPRAVAGAPTAAAVEYALAVDDFRNGGIWIARRAPDGRLAWLAHQPFALSA